MSAFQARGTFREQPAELRWNGERFDRRNSLGTHAQAMVDANVSVSLAGYWTGKSGDGELGARAVADVLLGDATFDSPAPLDAVPAGTIA